MPKTVTKPFTYSEIEFKEGDTITLRNKCKSYCWIVKHNGKKISQCLVAKGYLESRIKDK